jgi:hypothetical protein
MPEEALTDNGKQFTARFGRGGEVLFDRICRDNAISHRLTPPATPTTTGKIERFHQSLRRELLDDHPPFASLLAAQAALDSWVADYNCSHPHQALNMAFPADRFGPSQTPEARAGEALLPLRLPPALTSTPPPPPAPPPPLPEPVTEPDPEPEAPLSQPWTGGPVEFDRVVPTSGNLGVAGKQFWQSLPPRPASAVATAAAAEPPTRRSGRGSEDRVAGEVDENDRPRDRRRVQRGEAGRCPFTVRHGWPDRWLGVRCPCRIGMLATCLAVIQKRPARTPQPSLFGP